MESAKKKNAIPGPEIACQQALMHGSAVFSRQWTVVPGRHAATLTPQLLLERYLAHINHFTLSLVRPVRTAQGLGLRILSTGTDLLTFAGPLFSAEENVCSATLQISGGLLVQADQRNRGKFSFITETAEEGIGIILQLTDYYPSLLGNHAPSKFRKLIYRLTQAWLHRLVTIRFLARLCRELEGGGGRPRLVRVSMQNGEDI
jgi:hypothetical protein